MGVGLDAFKYGCDVMGIDNTNNLTISKERFKQMFGGRGICLQHNEFIVYNQNRYKIKYIIEVEVA
jgi:hypothetical protein